MADWLIFHVVVEFSTEWCFHVMWMKIKQLFFKTGITIEDRKLKFSHISFVYFYIVHGFLMRFRVERKKGSNKANLATRKFALLCHILFLDHSSLFFLFSFEISNNPCFMFTYRKETGKLSSHFLNFFKKAKCNRGRLEISLEMCPLERQWKPGKPRQTLRKAKRSLLV